MTEIPEDFRPLRRALLSCYHKAGLEAPARALHEAGVQLLASGGTADFLRGLGLPCQEVAELTGYPSILGGRVKTLHPAVFGGILARRADPQHLAELAAHKLPEIDLVVVDLYPFQQALAEHTQDEARMTELIDIGGVALLRAAAKNHADVAVVCTAAQYEALTGLAQRSPAGTTLAERRALAAQCFAHTAQYELAISHYLAGSTPLRYGENPHQSARYEGNLRAHFTQLHGKELSYNNLLDAETLARLLADLQAAFPGQAACAVIKHTNPCGVAVRPTAAEASAAALAADERSAFGGVIGVTQAIDLAAAQVWDAHFFEVLLAPAISPEARELLQKKKNRILLEYTGAGLPAEVSRTILGGTLVQQADQRMPSLAAHQPQTEVLPTPAQAQDLLLAEIVAKHLKSNAIVLVQQLQTRGLGQGQTSRVEALEQAIAKAREKGYEPAGCVLASDGFFPFADSAELALRAGIRVLLEPGGSVRDIEVINFCKEQGMCLIFTGHRHFRH